MGSSLNILHLEDNPLDVELVHHAVTDWGLPVQWHTVASSDEFHQALERRAFDAIVSDNSLPGLDGLQALTQARERRPDAPFIFLTGNCSERRVADCLQAGATDYVLKKQMWQLLPALRHLQSQVERDRLARQTQGQAVLIEVVQQLAHARTLADVMAIVRRGARQLTGSDGATFVLRDNDKCFYADEDAIEPLWKGLRFPLAHCISGWAMLNRQPACIPDIYLDDRIPHDAYRPTFVKSLVMVPIRSQNPIGAIGNYWATPHASTDQEVALIQTLADTTAVAIDNVQLYDQLEQRVKDRTAALEQANEELEAFSYSVSHDLRAPLRAIEGFASLLHERNAARLDDDGRRFLGTIRSSAERMGTIIEDLLDLARVGRTEPHLRRVNLVPLAHAVLTGLRAASPDRQVQVEMAPALWVHGDPGLLQTVLENLLSNAWKYSGRREQARIELGPFTADDGLAGFRVRDNGAGFDMAQAGQLFEPFRRLHAESDFTGIGIGLAIVRRVVQKHGGRVWAEAQKHVGATFCVVLPPAPDADTATD